jgi:tRNA(Arg) A34 adenosine deaminase TadA
MCASAISQSRISKVYIGTFNKDMGACGSVINLLDNRRLKAFQDAGLPIYYQRLDEIPKNEQFKFTTTNQGTSIEIRK